MINRLILKISFSFFCFQVIACDDVPVSAEIVESGLYSIQRISSIPYQGLPSNSLTNKAELVFIKETDEIEATLGNVLGYKYKISGNNVGEVVDLTVVMKYPYPGITDPGTGITHLKDKYNIPGVIGDTQMTYYSFDGEWELIPGEWTREIWHGCNKLVSRTYQVIK